jgi:hypothetical protein
MAFSSSRIIRKETGSENRTYLLKVGGKTPPILERISGSSSTKVGENNIYVADRHTCLLLLK